MGKILENRTKCKIRKIQFMQRRGIRMDINSKIDKNGIKRNMEELREILNEVCITQKNKKELKKRLILSQQLDQLIIAYMNKDNE